MNILSLDISTSCIGVSSFTDGELNFTSSIEPKIRGDYDKEEKLYQKVVLFDDYLNHKNVYTENYEYIIIEKPLISSSNIFTAAHLNFFQGMVFNMLKMRMPGAHVIYYEIDDIRITVFPELVSKKGTLYSDLPKEIQGNKISQYRKLIINYLIAQRYPTVEWDLNNNKKLNETNYDVADSLAVGTAFLIKHGIKQVESYDIEKAVEFLNKYYEYVIWSSKITGTVKEKNSLKVHYLNTIFEIANYMNVKAYINIK